MSNDFLFSFDHLIFIIIFIVFLYSCPKITKHALPYSYLIEKFICILLILEIVFEQYYLLSYDKYNFHNSLPISIGDLTCYMCIGILYFKNYSWFSTFFELAIVCSVGEILFFKNFPFDYPDIMYSAFLFSRCLLLFSVIYLVEVKKFKIQSNPVKPLLLISSMYFIFVLILNKITNSTYTYFLFSHNPISFVIFVCAVILIYYLNLNLNKEVDDDI